MTSKPIVTTRRSLLAAALATTAFPLLAAGRVGAASPSKAPKLMKIRLTFDGRTMIATLHDNPSSRDFASLLPLDLTIEDYADNEKIAYLPRKLTQEGGGPFGNERPYDLCYYAPWGNLAMFYAPYRHPGLIRLGRFDEGFEALHARGRFALRVERLD